MELKPCPFCAATDEDLWVWEIDGFYYVFCDGCGADGPWFYTNIDAMNAWNDRHYYGDTRVTNNDNDPRI